MHGLRSHANDLKSRPHHTYYTAYGGNCATTGDSPSFRPTFAPTYTRLLLPRLLADVPVVVPVFSVLQPAAARAAAAPGRPERGRLQGAADYPVLGIEFGGRHNSSPFNWLSGNEVPARFTF